jgi:hypothetical protein
MDFEKAKENLLILISSRCCKKSFVVTIYRSPPQALAFMHTLSLTEAGEDLVRGSPLQTLKGLTGGF